MPEILSLFALNRGVVSRLGLARVDIKRVAMAAEVQTNWMPRVLGSMTLRAGLAYLGGMLNNTAARMLKFIFATADTALLEMTPLTMRVWINDALLARPAVSTLIVNGTFAGSLAGWTQLDEVGAVSSFVGPNLMQLVGNGTARAIREQQVVVLSPGIEHGIRIVIARGPVSLRIGSISGEDDYVRETTLYAGTHSISLTPAGNFFIRFFSRQVPVVWVSNCTIEAAGVMALPTPWAAADLSHLRIDQSADVVFVACVGFQQRRIERRGIAPNARSWSVALYAPIDGPFKIQNTTPTTITPSGLNGNITLTASVALFKPTHVGALFSITSVGQDVIATGTVNGVFTASIRVTGIDNDRSFSVIISGNATASTVDLQRSYDNLTWANVGGAGTYTADTTTGIVDGLNNQIVFYRLFLTNRVAPDSIVMELRIGSGSVRGVTRITGYTSNVLVAAEVVINLGGTGAAQVWQEGQWSDLRGWPTSGEIHEGRLWWAGQNGIWGSISDAFDSFDETFPGNAGPINRTIGSGPVDTINWLLSLKGLMIGAQGTEFAVRASSLDEILTPTSFNVKSCSTQGSGGVDACKVDQGGYYVDRSGVKVFEISFDVRNYDYQSNDITQLNPELGIPGIVRMDVQRKPDTRLHCVRSDGTVIVAVVSKTEDVLAWIPVTTSGFVEDVVTLPAITGNADDQVYYVVRRTINGATVRYLEKWAQEIDCRGNQQLCRLADAHVIFSGPTSKVITGLSHLEGQQVVVWADGADVGTDDSARPWTQRYTVAGGQITLAAAATNAVVGLGYLAQFQSAKLGSQTQGGSPLNQQKKIGHIGILAADIHPKGIKFGPTLNDTGSMCMDDMPEIEQGTLVGDATRADYDENLIEFPGTWTTDARVCIQGQAPRPATVLAITPDLALFS